jgi:hypothetical protein
MTKAIYIIGGAGTGKSTFMNQLFEKVGLEHMELEDFHSKPNKKAVVTLRGHRVVSQDNQRGLYIGLLRDQFPGTDGLDRATSPTGKEWLELGKHKEFNFLIGEGNTLGTRPFLTALHEHTELLLVHLEAEEFVRELRFLERGSKQSMMFVLGTATRSANLLADMQKIGVRSLLVDSADPESWDFGLEVCRVHLEK